MPLTDAMEQAGFFKWQREAMQTAERQLKQLGRERAAQLHRWLLDTDLALKGSHSSPDMSRLAMEHLLLRLDQQLARARRAESIRRHEPASRIGPCDYTLGSQNRRVAAEQRNGPPARRPQSSRPADPT